MTVLTLNSEPGEEQASAVRRCFERWSPDLG